MSPEECFITSRNLARTLSKVHRRLPGSWSHTFSFFSGAAGVMSYKKFIETHK